jgi:hypothetical protein
MKRCPTCDKTFDDNLKFCQIDGTSLVDDAPVDPYKTMVASKEEIAAAMSNMAAEEPTAPEEPVLDIPSSPILVDPNATQVVSEAEMRAEMEKLDAADNQVIDVPPIAEPEPPKFSEPKLSAPSFGEPAPPPSPFSTGEESKPADEPFSMTSPPIPSPFGEPKPPSMEPSTPFEHEYSAPEEPTPPTPQFAEPEPAYNPFEHSAPRASEPLAQAEWTAPAASDTDMQNPQNFGQNAAPAAAGPNQTLAIISLVVGILSFCCSYIFIPGIIAIVLGFMARGKATNDPANYGGAGLALAGIICGGISLVLGVAVIILNVVFGFAGALMQGM